MVKNHDITFPISRRRLLHSTAIAGGVGLFATGSVTAYDFPSTNDDNRENGDPYVEVSDEDACEVTLDFVNPHSYLACFEVRIDGETRTSGTEHPVIEDDFIYENFCATDGTTTETFEARSTVEVRLALGAERDHDFDWVTFELSCDPETKADCMGGGWERFGFRNQGQCIRYVNTGKDSR